MQKGKALYETVKGEVRLCIEGGLAHFRGLAKEQTVSFDDLTTPESQEIASLADQAGFFSCTPANDSAGPDARHLYGWADHRRSQSRTPRHRTDPRPGAEEACVGCTSPEQATPELGLLAKSPASHAPIIASPSSTRPAGGALS